jgi:hypothetical protein
MQSDAFLASSIFVDHIKLHPMHAYFVTKATVHPHNAIKFPYPSVFLVSSYSLTSVEPSSQRAFYASARVYQFQCRPCLVCLPIQGTTCDNEHSLS